MSEEVAFSFKKKPIQYLPKQSSISEILPSNEKLKSKQPENYEINPNDVNYDEQIRAPRVNFKNFEIKYKVLDEVIDEEAVHDEVVVVDKGNDDDDNDNDKNDQHNDQNDDHATTNDKKEKFKYIPANFDLNHNNYTFSSSEINLSTDKLDAMKNLTNNLTTEERNQNPYKLKKPLSIPAVLRPNNSDSSPESNSPSSMLSLNLNTTGHSHGSFSSSGSGRIGRSASISAINDIKDIENFEPIEPSHDHWKPNNFTTSCMKCFSNFSIFNSRRRHHCRFCGFIICSNCLFNSSSNGNTNSEFALIYLDINSRLVIPIFKNLNNLELSKYFKLCKICKNCGSNYLNLLFQLNQINLHLPFIFIENPFINKDKKLIISEERKSSFSNNGDWNWSSF